jgi:hypothetical protein
MKWQTLGDWRKRAFDQVLTNNFASTHNTHYGYNDRIYTWPDTYLTLWLRPCTSVVDCIGPTSRVRSHIRSTQSPDIVTTVFQSTLITSVILAEWCNSSVDSPDARLHTRTSRHLTRYKCLPSGVICNFVDLTYCSPTNITMSVWDQ